MATALLFYLAIFMASGAITAAAPDELRVILFENVGWPFVREIEGSAGDYEGYEPAIAKAICDKLEVTCTFVPTNSLDARLELLNNGTADLAVATITVIPERNELVDFIEPYYYGDSFIIYSTNGTVDVTNGWEGLAGEPVCFDEGSVIEQVINRLNMIPVAIPTADEAAAQEQILANIKNGDCIGYFVDALSSTKFGLSPIDLPAQSFNPDSPSYLGMAVAKGNEELKKEITAANEALFEGGADSQILALEQEWLIDNGLKANAELAALVDPAPAPDMSSSPSPAPAPPSGATKPCIVVTFAIVHIIGAFAAGI